MNNKGFRTLPIIFTILALIVVAAIAYMVGKRTVQPAQVGDFTPATTAPSDTALWKSYTLGIFTFLYPPDWRISNEDNDIHISPPNPNNTNDSIVFKGIQANCDRSYPKCNYITDASGTTVFDLHTFSTNPATLEMYTKILATFTANGVKATIRAQGQ